MNRRSNEAKTRKRREYRERKKTEDGRYEDAIQVIGSGQVNGNFVLDAPSEITMRMGNMGGSSWMRIHVSTTGAKTPT